MFMKGEGGGGGLGGKGGTCGHGLSVFPIAGPGDADLRGGLRDVIEKLTGVVIFPKVGEASCRVDGGEDRPVERAGEVLRYGAALGSPRVDTNL